MRKPHTDNERIKRQYFIYLEEAKRMAPSSVDQVAAAVAAFEVLTKYRDFKKFNTEQARQFKRQLREQINPKTGKQLAKATINTRLKALRAFFIWLAGQPGYRLKLSFSDTDYFNDSNHNERVAAAVREKRVPTIEQIRHVLKTMPNDTDIEKTQSDTDCLFFALRGT